jgi:hypothetical protein
MARSTFPSQEPRTRPDRRGGSHRPSLKPTTPAPSGRYRAAAAEAEIAEVPKLPVLPKFDEPFVDEAPATKRPAQKAARQSIRPTVRMKRVAKVAVAKGAVHEVSAPRKRGRDPRSDDD